MGAAKDAARRRRRRAIRAAAYALHARDNTGDGSATASHIVDEEDDNQDENQNDNQEINRSHRCNSSSSAGDNDLVALDMDPAVSDLVRGASQMIGSVEQDGAAMALAATTAANPLDSLNLLAASAAMANVRLERVGEDATQAVTEAHMARQDLQRLEDRLAHIELELKVHVINERLALLERLVIRLVSILRNATFDTTEVEDMIQNLNIS